MHIPSLSECREYSSFRTTSLNLLECATSPSSLFFPLFRSPPDPRPCLPPLPCGGCPPGCLSLLLLLLLLDLLAAFLCSASSSRLSTMARWRSRAASMARRWGTSPAHSSLKLTAKAENRPSKHAQSDLGWLKSSGQKPTGRFLHTGLLPAQIHLAKTLHGQPETNQIHLAKIGPDLFGPNLTQSARNQQIHLAKIWPDLFGPNLTQSARNQQIHLAKIWPDLFGPNLTHSARNQQIHLAKIWPDLFGQNLTQSARTQSDPGWFCTKWSRPPAEEGNWIWQWEIGSSLVVFC